MILSAKSEEMVKWAFAVADELEKFSVQHCGRKNGLGADSEEDKVIRLPIQKSADVRRKCQVRRFGAFERLPLRKLKAFVGRSRRLSTPQEKVR